MRIKSVLSIILVLSTLSASAQDTITFECPNCKGSGSLICGQCGGLRGFSMNTPFGVQWNKCWGCGGSGETLCLACGGGGKVTLNTSNHSNYSTNGSGTNYNGNSSNPSSNNSNNSSRSTAQRRKCGYCNNGREMIERSINVYTGGIKVNQRSCSECGRTYDANQWAHFHQQCSHCRGKGYIE